MAFLILHCTLGLRIKSLYIIFINFILHLVMLEALGIVVNQETRKLLPLV